MTAPLTPREERTLELLVDRADGSLSKQDASELASLLREHPHVEHDIDRAAAAVALAQLDEIAPLPEHLARQLEATARMMLEPIIKLDDARTVPLGSRDGGTVPIVAPAAGKTVPIVPTSPAASTAATAPSAPAAQAPQPAAPLPPTGPFGTARSRSEPVAPAPVASVVPLPRRGVTFGQVAPWLLAAACFAFAITAWFVREPAPTVFTTPPPPSTPSSAPPPPPRAPTFAEQRELMLARGDAVTAEWTATKDPAAKGATGDVVWSPTEQMGFMRFRGLAANDPKVSQYQLWIFDKTQDAKTPIDGGVFDVDSTTGDVLVPITAKLRVKGPTLFAVTIERPGGVVVSKRERIVVTGSPKA
jgi:hypothetical protein